MEQSTSPPATPTNETKGPREMRSILVRAIWKILLVCFLFAFVILFVLKWPDCQRWVHGKALEKIRLAPMSLGNTSWTIPPATTIRAYRLFDIKNYMTIMTDMKNPLMEFRETEPFLFKLAIKKNNVEWLDNNTTIHYSVERFFTRHGEYTKALLDQQGAFIDILRVMFRTKYGSVADSVFYMLGGNNAFNYSKAIDKLEGYISPMFAAISSRMQGPNRDKYGFIYRYNGTNGFNYTILTGINDLTIKGQMVDFASEYTPFKTSFENWQTTMFDGMTFPILGNPTNRKVINVFQPDFCRPVQLRYNRTVSKFGFPHLHEYVLKLVDVEKCPEMDEFCPEADKIDITKCLSAEIPAETLYLTKPHLYGHNSSYTNVDFKPDFDKHESTIYFEPITGTPIQAQLRIQLNTNAWIDRLTLNPDGSTDPSGTRAVRRFTPMVWIDQKITVNEEAIKTLKTLTVVLEKINYVHQSLNILYTMIAFVSVIAILLVVELILLTRRNKMAKSVLYEPAKDQEKELLSPSKATAVAKA
ncbi:unnamed protein product [Rotaria socialis]|uniref:Uncharacterized protein n=2 Tax=Rotaria socialis TaxID=392032 RepID=A0A818FW41_9BILA|nr:unnamed protein product [Rotaria socialis]